MANAIEQLLRETVVEVRGLRKEISFLKARFADVTHALDKKIRDQRGEIVNLTAALEREKRGE